MGLFDIFRKKKKEVKVEPRTLRLEKVPELLKKLEETKYQHIFTSIAEHKKNIQTSAQQLEGLIRGLRKEALRNTKIPQKHVSIMEGNRINYTKQHEAFLNNITLSDDIDQLAIDVKEFKARLDKLGQITFKNQQILKEFFNVTIQRINKVIVDLTRSVEGIQKAVTSKPITLLHDIRDDLSKIDNYKATLAKRQQEIAEINDQIAQLKEREKKLLKYIDELQHGQEYETYKKLSQELEEKAKQHTKAVESFLHDFSSIQKALLKYQRTSVDEDLINQYLHSTLSTLSSDTPLKLLEILKKLQEALTNNTIYLDDRKKQKTLTTLATLTPERLKTLQETVKTYETESNELRQRLKRDTAVLTLEQQKNHVQQNVLRIQTLEAERTKLQKESTSPSEIVHHMQETLQTLTGQETNILYDASLAH